MCSDPIFLPYLLHVTFHATICPTGLTNIKNMGNFTGAIVCDTALLSGSTLMSYP